MGEPSVAYTGDGTLSSQQKGMAADTYETGMYLESVTLNERRQTQEVHIV